jgi:hypothetical protein
VTLAGDNDFGSCPCGGTYELRTVVVRITDGDEPRVLLEDVPQGACPNCGSRVYKAAMLESIEAALSARPAAAPRNLL